MVPAEHSSSVDVAVMKPESPSTLKFLEGGQAVGYVIEFENGFRIYHSGDT
jgi:L-ascorbate metabolism protein UlaG (beta-lactamase superfamily)